MKLGCLLCHTVTKGEKTMLTHLVKHHEDTVSCHLNIVDNFSCEEGSDYWKKFIAPTLQSIVKEGSNKQ
jgi:hypothetical protein